MNLYIDRDALKAALTRALTALDKQHKRTIWLRARHEGLELLAQYGQEIAAVELVAANVEASGEAFVDAYDLAGLVPRLPEPTVHIEVQDHGLVVLSGRVAVTLGHSEEAKWWPVMGPTGTATIEASDLLRLIERAAYAVSTDGRYGLNGAHLERVGDKLRMVATDGHRLALAEVPVAGEFEIPEKTLIPRDALKALGRQLRGHEEDATVEFADTAARVSCGGWRLWFQLLEGVFPEYAAVVPAEDVRWVLTDRAGLLATFQRGATVAGRRHGLVVLEAANGGLGVSCSRVGEVRVEESVSCEEVGAQLKTGFAPKYMVDCLSRLEGDTVALDLAGPIAPCRVRDPDDDSCYHIVMPQRVE